MFNREYKNLNAWILFCILTTLMQSGCGRYLNTRTMKLEDLNHSDPAVRVMAIKWAGENKLKQAVPQLVELLPHEDKAIRFYSIQGLVRITGTDNGYDYKADAKSRSAAVRRWRQFSNSNISSDHES